MSSPKNSKTDDVYMIIFSYLHFLCVLTAFAVVAAAFSIFEHDSLRIPLLIQDRGLQKIYNTICLPVVVG